MSWLVDKTEEKRFRDLSKELKRKYAKIGQSDNVAMDWLAGESGTLYGEFCLRAALDSHRFTTFRRDPVYTPILEHVDARTGREYLHHILETGLSVSEVIKIVEPLQRLGGPILLDVGAGQLISTTALRYLKVALDIVRVAGRELGRVVEIGCGFGGQAIILSRLASICHYTFIDMWQVNLLIQRFIEESEFSVSYTINTIRQAAEEQSYDIVISNYAFSELDQELQAICVRKFLLASKHGYLTMNTGLTTSETVCTDKKHLSSDVLSSLLASSRIEAELPATSHSNYVVLW